MFGTEYVIGVDEVGTGAWAGPICACAFLAPSNFILEGLTDSKKLTPKKRTKLVWDLIPSAVSVSVQTRSAEDVVRKGHTNMWVDAIASAVGRVVADCRGLGSITIVVDGNFNRKLSLAIHLASSTQVWKRTQFIVGADAKIPHVSAASVIAKVHRDGLMEELSAEVPGYGWERNKGYGSKEHREALRTLGPTVYHRKYAHETFGQGER